MLRFRLPAPIVLVILGLVLLSSGVVAGSPGDDSEATTPPVGAGKTTLASKRVLTWLPQSDLHAPYLADPHRTGFGILSTTALDNDIPETGDARILLRLGARFGIVRLHEAATPGLGWQASFDASIDAMFDGDRSLDNIGWDGNFGWYLTHARRGGWSFRFGWSHVSSHLGDEYVERTGRARIDYTRREYLAGASKRFGDAWRVYLEGAYGRNPGNAELQEPGRVQTGVEFERPATVWKHRLGVYAGADLSAMEERDWRVDTAIQAGVSVPVGDRVHRVGVEVYDGRVPVGEFFRSTESYVSLGLWIDVGS